MNIRKPVIVVCLTTMASNSRLAPIAAPKIVPEITQEVVLSTGPTVCLNVPTGHCAHLPVAVTVPVKPGLHKQASICVLPTVVVELAGHAAHSRRPEGSRAL